MTALLLTAPLGAGGAVLADGSANAEGHEVQIQSADAAEIDGALREAADGETVEVVVRMSAERSSRARPSAEGSPAELKRAARSTQSAFESYAADTQGVEVKSGFWIANAVVAAVDTGEVPLEELAKVDGVVRLHANHEVELQRAVGADAASRPAASPSLEATAGGYQTTYGVETVNATAVWDAYDTRGAGAKVAVLDTGVDVDHPDVDLHTEDPTNATYPGGWAEFDSEGNRIEGSEPKDPNGHGTHVSGTVAGGNATGTHIGVAPNVTLMHGKVLDGGGTYTQVIAGIEWAVEADADVVTMSLGAKTYQHQYIEPIRNARSSGTVVVAAIGNEGADTSDSPGNVYDTLSVGATNSSDDVADFSSGETIDTDATWGSDAPDDWPDEYVVPNVAAPGVDVYSAYPGGRYAYLDGTSMAAPHVAGVAALVVSAAPSKPTPAEIDAAFEESARKPAGAPDGVDTRYGHGIVDAYAASLGSLNGTVTASGTTAATQTAGGGDPVENATVTIYENGTQVANVTTGADGEYAFEGVETGNYTVEFDHDDYAAEQRDVRIDPGGSITEDAALDYAEGGTITGDLELSASTNEDVAVTVTARDGDGEAANETVVVAANETVGAYELAVDVNVEEGYTVTADADGYHENVTDLGGVDVNETVEANLALPVRESSVIGTVTATGTTAATRTAAGEPVENASVSIYENGTQVANVTTDADGEYRLGGLVPADYVVVADDEPFAAGEWSGWIGPNETRTADFQLDYAEGGTIAGTVELDVVDPGENVTVTVAAADGENRYATDLALDENTSTAEYALEDVAVNVDSGYEVVATTDAAYANASVSGVEVWVNETVRADATMKREPGSLDGIYEVNVTGTNAPVEVDETLAVDANVTNVGGRGYRNVSLAVEADDGTVVGIDRVVPLLEAGENATVTLEWPASVDAGEYTARVSTPDDEDNVTVTVEPASTSGGGGGGGGGGGLAPSGDDGDGDDAWPEPDRRDSQAIQDADPDAPGVTVRFSGTNLEEIVFSNEDASGAVSQRASVEEVDDLSSDAPALPERTRAVSVSRITVPEEHRDRPATLRKRISSERLERLDADPEELTVYRLPDGSDEWQSLEAAVTETDDGVVVAFETPGFSAFAVAQEERQTEGTPTPSGAAETPTPTPSGAAETPTPTPTDAGDGPDVGLIGLIVVVVLAIGGGAVYYSTLREPEE